MQLVAQVSISTVAPGIGAALPVHGLPLTTPVIFPHVEGGSAWNVTGTLDAGYGVSDVSSSVAV